jgi:hypothetical protein
MPVSVKCASPGYLRAGWAKFSTGIFMRREALDAQAFPAALAVGAPVAKNRHEAINQALEKLAVASVQLAATGWTFQTHQLLGSLQAVANAINQ